MALTGLRYSLCKHVFWTKEGSEERAVCYHYVDLEVDSLTLGQVLSLPPAIAPTKVLLVPLSGTAAFKPMIADLTKLLRS